MFRHDVNSRSRHFPASVSDYMLVMESIRQGTSWQYGYTVFSPENQLGNAVLGNESKAVPWTRSAGYLALLSGNVGPT